MYKRTIAGALCLFMVLEAGVQTGAAEIVTIPKEAQYVITGESAQQIEAVYV